MIRVFEAFAGYGSQSLALERLNIPHEVVCISEIDKYAIQAYEALHGVVRNLGDISKINVEDIPEHDLFTYSFPCQDISVAGNQKGLIEGQTRSGLLWECERIIEAKKPKYLLMENVKNLVSKKFKPDFDKWGDKLESLGYTNYWKVLNAKDYGIPQNRERVFMISILGDHVPYEFPIGYDNGLRLKDMLEDEVEEKYYISQEKCEKLIKQLKHIEIKDTAKPNLIGGIGEVNYGKQYRQGNRVYDGNSIAMACLSQPVGNAGGNSYLYAIPCLTPDRVEKRQNGRRFKEDGEPMFTLTGQDRHGVLQVGNYRENGKGFTNPQTGRVYSTDGCSPTLNTMQGGDRQPKVLLNYRIRKLTPKECFRLMGLNDDDINKIKLAGISNSQQYKLAGNSIVVDVLETIFRHLLA